MTVEEKLIYLGSMSEYNDENDDYQNNDCH